jgi:hypothetical protein
MHEINKHIIILLGWMCKMPSRWSAPQERMWSTPKIEGGKLSTSVPFMTMIKNNKKKLPHVHPLRKNSKNINETKQEHAKSTHVALQVCRTPPNKCPP